MPESPGGISMNVDFYAPQDFLKLGNMFNVDNVRTIIFPDVLSWRQKIALFFNFTA